MDFLIRFDDELAHDPLKVGYKFYSLAKAARAGFSVPPAVAISTEAHRRYLAEKKWPEGLVGEVFAIADELGLSEGLSIRSSATREDLEQQSFAGQYRTFLKVINRGDIKKRIEQCWESAHSDSVISYLNANDSFDDDPSPPLMAVVLQKMVNADVAGVAFGKNPLHPSREEIVIEAVEGLADNLVDGSVTPHRAFVTRQKKIRGIDTNSGDGHRGKHVPLDTAQWLEITDLLMRVEGISDKKHLDIEWAIDAGRQLWLLQFRAITTIDPDLAKLPTGMWTRKIADDLWADRLTPYMSQVMLRNAPRFDLSQFAQSVGLPVIKPTLAIIDGYLYVNADSIKEIFGWIPRPFRSQQLKALLPPVVQLESLRSPSLIAQLKLCMRSALLLVRTPMANPWLCLKLAHRGQRRFEKQLSTIGDLPTTTSVQAWQKTKTAVEALARIQAFNQWPYLFAAVFTWTARWLMVELQERTNDEFLQRLQEGADNVTIRIEREIRDMAEQISTDTLLVKQFLAAPTESAVGLLPPKLQHRWRIFLEQYGCRSRHRTLYVKRWAEDVDQILKILQALIEQRTDRSDPDIHQQSPAERLQQSRSDSTPSRHPRQLAIQSKGGLKRQMAAVCTPLLLNWARKYLDLREDLRFLLDQCLLQIRTAIIGLGHLTGLGDDILFLKEEEIQQLVEQQIAVKEVKAVAQNRRQTYLQPSTPSPYLVDGSPLEEFNANGRTFQGMGTSPGRVAGTARIVEDPTGRQLHKSDILIAKTTDPGWTPVLSRVGGMVIEEGGLLNHCSIVARELKIPAVVGIYGATRRINDGSLITIDGGLGVVRIEDG